MEQDVKRLLNDLKEENFTNILLALNIDPDNFEEELENIIEKYRDEIHRTYFSYVDKYLDDPSFFEALDVLENVEVLYFSKLFISDEFFNKILDIYLENNNDLRRIELFDENDVNLLINKGFSLSQIINDFSLYTKAVNYIYDLDNSLGTSLVKNFPARSEKIVVDELQKGNYHILEDYSNISFYYSSSLNKLLTQISTLDKFDMESFIKNFLMYKTSSKDISVIDDENVILNLIHLGSSQAIIFSNNPTEAIVNAANDFSFNDYSLIDGSYKNSSHLLLKFLNAGKLDALLYAKGNAITEEVISKIEELNISTDFLLQNKNLLTSLEFNKYLHTKGIDDNSKRIKNLFTDIASFDYVYGLLEKGFITPEISYDDNREFSLLAALYTKNYSFIKLNWGSRDMSVDVAKRIISLGLSANDYIKYMKNNYDVLSEEYVKKGDYIVLLDSSEKLILKHLDKITYDLFMSYVKEHDNYEPHREIIYKLVKEGHYDILSHLNNSHVLSTLDIEKLGLKSITYEEYLNLPEEVQNIPTLKEKFIEYNKQYLYDLLSSSPSLNVLEYAALNGMSLNELENYVKNYSYFTSKTVLHYIENGEKEAIKYLPTYGPDIEIIIRKYYELLNGDLPSKSALDNSLVKNELFKLFVQNNDYRLVNKIDYLNNECIKALLESTYSYEDFKAFPVYNGIILTKLITHGNLDEIINQIKSENNKLLRITNLETLLIYMYHNNYSDEEMHKISELGYVNVKNILKNISKEEYDIFNKIDLNSFSNDLMSLGMIMPYLATDTIKKYFSQYISDDVNSFLVRKMVERGHYEFIDYYSNKLEEDVIKRALMGGYFPEEKLLKNSYFNLFVKNLHFTPEEYDYLKSKIDMDVRFIIFFPEILENPHILHSYLEKDISIYKFLPENLKKDIEVLKVIARVNPEYCGSIITYNTGESTIITLLKENYELIKYLQKNLINETVLKEMIPFHPECIDHSSYPLNESTILLALTNGYEISNNSSLNCIIYALNNHYPVNIDILYQKSFNDIMAIMEKTLSISNYEAFYTDILSKIKEQDKYEFIYNIVKYRSNVCSIIDENIANVLNNFNIDFTKPYNINDKEDFIISLKLDDLPISKESLTKIDALMSSTPKKAECLKWINEHFDPNDSYVISKIQELAKKYFKDDPLQLVKYVNKTDPEVIAIGKECLNNCPNLYKDFPELLDNKELIISLIGKTKGEIYKKLKPEFKNDLEILELSLKENENLIYSSDITNPIIKKFAREKVLMYPTIFKAIPEILDNKELILQLVSFENGTIIDYLAEKYLQDPDIATALVSVDYTYILKIPTSNPHYYQLVKVALSKNGELFIELKDVITMNDELLQIALKTYGNAYFQASEELQNKENFALIENQKSLDFTLCSGPLLSKIINFGLLDIDDLEISSNITSALISHLSELNNIDSTYLGKILSNGLTNSGNENFQKIIANIDKIDINIFPAETKKIIEDTLHILSSTGKINTMEKNPVFSYEVVKYIYPIFGLDFVKDLIKYNTPAAEKIINEIKANNIIEIQKYYDFIVENNIFEANDKRVSFAFRDYDTIKELVHNLLLHKSELKEQDIYNFKKIIMNRNMYSITTFEELQNYKDKTESYCLEQLNGNNIIQLKNYLATIFGYPDISSLTSDMSNFQFDNYSLINIAKNDILKKYGEEKGHEILKKVSFTKFEISLITLMSRIISSNNLEELQELIVKLVKEKEEIIDYCDNISQIKNKLRCLYTYQFNGHLTKPEELHSKKLDKDDPTNPYGITIIEMDSEKFNFLAHRLYNYDPSMNGFSQSLMDDPSLWFKLEGASTISTSSFSDKGFWFLNSNDPNGVVYLFNDLPENFLLFMYGRDLYVSHGGHNIEPVSKDNSFTNIDALNQSSCYHDGHYNEVAGFREGVIPCAFACTGDKPNEATIRAAKYFSELLGRDIPIIKFNIKAYNTQKEENLQKAKESMAEKVTYENIYNLFFDGIKVGRSSKNIISDKVDFCLENLNKQHLEGKIDFNELLSHLQEMSLIINQVFSGFDYAARELRKIELLKKTIASLHNMTASDIIDLETAKMGESGIMYKYREGDKEYLIKPAVDKQKLSTQNFRAEIQEASSKLQSILSAETSVQVSSIGSEKYRMSKQELIKIDPDKKNLLSDWCNQGGQLEERYTSSLLREYVIDFTLCNFDAFAGNFIIDEHGNLRGIDKEQSFRFINNPDSLKPDFSFVPNGYQRIPIYKLLFERYERGEIDLNFAVAFDTIEKLKMITDEDYREIFKPYASSLSPEESDKILDMIVNRKNMCINIMEEYLQKLQDMRKGVKK